MGVALARPSPEAPSAHPTHTRPFTPKDRRFPSALQPQAVENRPSFPNLRIPLTPPTPVPSPPRNGAFQAPPPKAVENRLSFPNHAIRSPHPHPSLHPQGPALSKRPPTPSG
jgi:hypothetical protein